MKPSRKFLSLPIISLREGQHIGYVKNLILSASEKCVAAIVVDPKGFFKDQRIIPYDKVISVGDDAITIDKGCHVEKSTSLPELLELLKDKLNIIGTKVVTESGKTLGVAEEYFIDPIDGKITSIEISGGKIEGLFNGKANLDAEKILTIGHDVIVAIKGSESELAFSDKGLNDTIKSILHTTSHLASETTHTIGQYFKKDKPATDKESTKTTAIASDSVPLPKAVPDDNGTDTASTDTASTEPIKTAQANTTLEDSETPIPSTKEPLG